LQQYKAGTVTYLNVVTAQATALTNERTAVSLQSRRLLATVSLVRALGGGWSNTAHNAMDTVPYTSRPMGE
jgi:outer membrane protein TolC